MLGSDWYAQVCTQLTNRLFQFLTNVINSSSQYTDVFREALDTEGKAVSVFVLRGDCRHGGGLAEWHRSRQGGGRYCYHDHDTRESDGERSHSKKLAGRKEVTAGCVGLMCI